MQKTKLVFEELKSEFDSQKLPKTMPSIHWLPIGNQSSEDFHASLEGNIIKIKAEGYLGAIHALQKMRTRLISQHLADCLGSFSPRFKIRPLWIEQTIKEVLKEPHRLHVFCKRVLELGFNSIVVEQTEESVSLRAFCKNIQSYGLKVILKLSFLQGKLKKFSPVNSLFQDQLAQSLQIASKENPYFDFLFWESQWLQPEFMDSASENYTLHELTLLEAQLIEKNLEKPKGLIFYVPALDHETAKKSAKWMQRLADDLENRTILSFSVLSGDFTKDFLPPHPLGLQIRAQIEPSSAALMPLINVGNVKQGEGLWPILVYDHLDECIGRCQNGNFVGLLAITNHLPLKGGILDCNLWVTGQVLQKNQPAFLYTEIWFSIYKPDWDYAAFSPVLKQIRDLLKSINLLYSLTDENYRSLQTPQECRTFAESILSQLASIRLQLEKEERKKLKESTQPTLWDYFIFFANDMRKILLNILQSYGLSASLDESQSEESFWIEFQMKSRDKQSSRSKLTFLEAPNQGPLGSRMHSIYKENRLF